MRRLPLLIALVFALVAGCGDDGGSGGGGGDGGGAAEPVTLKVGVIPIADVAPLYLGMDKGFFEEEGLTIEPQLAEGGAAIVPSVVSGDYQIGFSNTTSLIIAGSKKLPIQIISQGVLAGTGPDDAWDGVIVPKGSDVKDLAGLEGKTVAVNTLNNVSQVVVNTALKEAGADYTKVKYVEVPFPDMNAALESGRVDAAFQVEPGYSGGLAAGSKNIVNAYEAMAPNYTVATYFASKQYIAEHRDEVDRFNARDAEVARVRVRPRRRGPRDRRHLHGDPAGGARQDEPARVEGRPERADDRADVGRRARSTASSRRSRPSTT